MADDESRWRSQLMKAAYSGKDQSSSRMGRVSEEDIGSRTAVSLLALLPEFNNACDNEEKKKTHLVT